MKSIVLDHPVMKLISLALAFFLWFFVKGERKVEVSVGVKLQMVNKPEAYVVVGEVEPKISLRLIGPQTQIAKIDDTYFESYQLDLSRTKKGTNSFWIHEEDFSIPRDVRIMRIVPQVIRISLDEAQERLMEIKPRFVHELEEGFELVSQEVIPSYLRVRGGRRELANTTHVLTEPISLLGRRTNFEIQVMLMPAESLSWVEEKRVLVKVGIAERQTSKTIREVPVVISGFSDVVKAEPNTVSLRGLGKAGRVAAWIEKGPTIEITPRQIPASLRRKGKFRMALPLPKEDGVEITGIPNSLQITIVKQ